MSIRTYAETNSWANGTAYTTIALDSYVTASGNSSGNNSKYYSSNYSWRQYEGDGAGITIETSSGTLSSVTFTYASGNNGIIKDGSTTVSSGSAYTISGSSKSFTVGHSTGTKNGNVQITAISVSYTPGGGGTTYTVTYSLNGGGGTTPTESAKAKDATFTLHDGTTGITPPSGKMFDGWLCDIDDVKYAGGATYTMTAANTTFTAQWVNIPKYTVTWHVGESTSTTSNVNHGTTFSSLTPPAHADNALAQCGSTKFIGWVTSGGIRTTDGGTVALYNSNKVANDYQITSNIDFYAMYAEGDGAGSVTLTNSDLTSVLTGSYGDHSITKTIGTTSYTFNLNACEQSSKCQMKKDAGCYIQIPTLPGAITGLSTTACGDASGGNYTGTLRLKSSAAAGNTTTDDLETKELSNVTSFSWDISSTITTAYLTTSAGLRIADLTIYYGTYINYRTGCTVTCSAPSPAAVANISNTGATISWAKGPNGTIDHYEYKVWVDGDEEPATGTSNGTSLSKALTGLYSGLTYHWKVRAVCTGDDESLWASGADFATTDASLTFSVPTGVTAVTEPTTTAGDLNSAGVPTACGDCWAFAGWTTAAYPESSSAPAALFPAGTKARVSGDATLYAVYGRYTADGKSKYRIIDDVTSITSNENYILTIDASSSTDAVGNTHHASYYAYIYPVEVTVETDATGEYIETSESNMVWKFTGTTSAGRLYNESASKYIDLHSQSADMLVSSTSDYVNITLFDAATKKFNIGSNTTTAHYLQYYENGVGSGVYYWGIDDDHDGYFSCRIFKRVAVSYTTSPDCSTYTVTFDKNNGTTHDTKYVTACDGYLATLPTAPANNTLSACMTNPKFMGWSPNKVMPAQSAVPTGMFNDVADAPEITESTTFYAVFAEEHTGSVAPTNKTFTFTSGSWADDLSGWDSGSAGNWYNSAVQVTKNNTGANATTKDSYDDVTKVTVTYFTNGSSGAGTIDIQVNGTSYTGSTSVTSTGGTTPRTIDFTNGTALDGNVKITVTCSTNSVYIQSVQIFYTGSTSTYDSYRTACCDDSHLTFGTIASPVTEYVITRQNLASASTAVEIDCDFESSNTTNAIEWKSTHRNVRSFVTPTGAYTWTSPTAQPSELSINTSTKKISAATTGVYTITIKQVGTTTGTIYCDAEATVTVTVKTVDKFVDAVNGNFSGEPQSLEDIGGGILLPTEETFTTNNACHSTTRRLVGWIKASDLATYASSGRVNYIDDWKTGDASNKVIAPGTRVAATGCTWYAVWGVEQ